jgi:hypothetical protein
MFCTVFIGIMITNFKCNICSSSPVFHEPIYGYYVCKKHKEFSPLQIHEAVLAINKIGGMTVNKFYINWGIKL